MSFRRLFLWNEPSWISADDGRARVLAGATLVDVRRNGDWRAAHALGSLHVPLEELTERAGSLPADRAVVVLAPSTAGGRAAAHILGDARLRAYVVRGGVEAWESSGGSVQRTPMVPQLTEHEERMSTV